MVNNMENHSVAILMSTFNGEKYIANQIFSLLQQRYNNWTLYIRDDGSSDATKEIIAQFSTMDKRIHFVDQNISNLGVGKSFISLVRHSNCDLTIFCDQDDIWLENKLEAMVHFASSVSLVNNPRPSLIYADALSFDSLSGDIETTVGVSQLHAKSLKDYLFFNGGYQGCSIMFNKPMANFLADYRGFINHHDDVVSLVAHCLGNVDFLPKKLMLYRQHNSAVTGNKRFNENTFRKIFWGSKTPVISAQHFKVKKTFFDSYSFLLEPKTVKLFEVYFHFVNSKNLLKSLILILLHGLTFGGSRITLIGKILLRPKINSII